MGEGVKRIIIAALFLGLPLIAQGHSYQHGDIAIGHVWAEPVVKGQGFGISMPIVNRGAPDRLVGFTVAACAGAQGFHRAPDASVDKIDLPRGRPLNLNPSGVSLRCYEAARDLKKGDRLNLTLRFEKAPPLTVEVYIEPSPYAP